MRRSHYITLFVAVALIAAMYWGINTVPPKQDTPKPQAGAPHADDDHHDAVAPATTEEILEAAIQALPEHAAEEAKQLRENAMVSSSTLKIAEYQTELAQLLQQHKQVPAAAYYYTEAAKLENSEKRLNFAARLNSELLRNAESPSVRAWAVQQAIDAYKLSMELNPDNDTVKMELAACYIDGTEAPMQGIQLLLGITREKPDNIPANLMLGQLSIRSGQIDKAQERFERVLGLDPKNTEALYFLAEVYKSKGDKKKAVELLEQCKRIVNNPEFSKEIDNYIKTF